MKILVTGASGFLGSHVADALSDSGHEVILFDVKPSPYRREDQTMVVGDVLDICAFEKAMADCEVVYHMAAIADIDDAHNRPTDTVKVNILGTANALEIAQRLNVKRFVFGSTIYVYSNQGTFYRTSKRAGELLIEDYQQRYGLNYTILRFGSLYGPRADRNNGVHRMLSQALSERRIEHPGTGDEIREYIQVKDAAEAAVQILDTSFINESISLTGHERTTIREIMQMSSEILGGNIEINILNESSRPHYTNTPYSYSPKLGKKLVLGQYIDLGLGLLDCISTIDQERQNSD